MRCYVRYSDEGAGQGADPPSVFGVPNVTTDTSKTSVPNIKHPLASVAALRDGDVLLFVCSFVCSSVCRQ